MNRFSKASFSAGKTGIDRLRANTVLVGHAELQEERAVRAALGKMGGFTESAPSVLLRETGKLLRFRGDTWISRFENSFDLGLLLARNA